ncbi:MAG: sulfotransferase [Prochloraceae cyanobacterium]
MNGKAVFVVGTGRCGSTMLSNMLKEHPDILSISEFFSCVGDFGFRLEQIFTQKKIDGKDFWNIISAIAPVTNLAISNDIAATEIIYPFKANKSRFNRKTGVPVILHVCLPHITADHDDLFDEIREYVIDRPVVNLGTHYQDLFIWLQKRFNKQLWIERSGGSISYIVPLNNMFPNARFIHIVRDGRTAAISMSKHLSFKIYLLAVTLKEYLEINPYENRDRSKVDRLPENLKKFLPENFDRLAFIDYEISLEKWGEVWSQQIINGLEKLNQIESNRILTIVYEDLIKEPRYNLEKIMDFLGKDFWNEIWIKKAASIIKKPRSSWQDLPEHKQNLLRESCQPGIDEINKVGISFTEKKSLLC